MTVAQKRSTTPKFDNSFLSGLQKQLPELVPPAIALVIFLAIWQLFSWTPGATLPGPIQVIQDTWILILYPFYDKGGTDKGLFWQIWASLQRVAISYRTHLISFQAVFATDSRLSISRIKHRLSLALERSSVRSKFLTKLLHLSTQAFDLSITHLAATGTNPDCPFVSFSAFDGLVESSN